MLFRSKKDLVEISGNLCSVLEHNRIKREITKACDIGCERFVFLIADNKIEDVSQVANWKVPIKKDGSLYTKVRPEILQKIMETMQEKYGVEFIFCKRKNMGKRIVELLENNK